MKEELRKWIIALTVGLLLGIITTSAIAEEYTFRKTTWGMNKEQVKQTEKEKEIIYEDETMLAYDYRMLELNCKIVYIFVEGKLVRTKYPITEEHTNKNQYILDYNILRAALSKKYGKPLDAKLIWINPLYESDPQNWGLAISIGHMVDYTKWETLQTIIYLALLGDNYEIQLAIEYVSKELDELEEIEREKETLEAL